MINLSEKLLRERKLTKNRCQHQQVTVLRRMLSRLAPASQLLENGCNLPFPDETFDCVYSIDIIEHVPDDKRFLQESLRVLRRKGIIIVGTPNHERLSLRMLQLIGRPMKFPRLLGKDPIYGEVVHLREYSRNSLVDLFKQRP